MQMPYVSERLWKEIRFSAKAVSEIVGRDVECEGLILSDYGGNLCKYSVIPKQDITPVSSICYGLHDLFKEAYSKNQRVMGVWHSHGSFNVFHSSCDDNHLAQTIAPLVKEYDKLCKRKITLEEDEGGIRLNDSSKSYLIKVKFGYKIREYMFEAVEEDLEDNVLSIVVNSVSNNYYAEIANEEVRLKIIPDKTRIDEENIIKDIGNNIRFDRILLKDYPNFENVLKKYRGKLRANIFQRRLSRINRLEHLTNILIGKVAETWEERLVYFHKEYLRLKYQSNLHEGIRRLESIVSNNRYFNRRHKSKAKIIKTKLCELKHRSIYKKVRKSRYERNKSKKCADHSS